MPQASLKCVNICAKSGALLTQHGKLPGVGHACGTVQTRFGLPGLGAVVIPSLDVPSANDALPLLAPTFNQASLAFITQAHAPPVAIPLQAVLSVPVAQAPPSFI